MGLNLFQNILNNINPQAKKAFAQTGKQLQKTFAPVTNFGQDIVQQNAQAIQPAIQKVVQPIQQSISSAKSTIQKGVQINQVSKLFPDEKSAYDKMLADNIPHDTAINVISQRRKSIMDTVGVKDVLTPQEQEALTKMKSDGVDSITAAGMLQQYRNSFKDRQTQLFEEKYKAGTPAQKALYNTLALGAGNLETLAKYGGNILDFATFGKLGFGEDVKQMENATQSPEFQTSSAYKAGTYLPDVALGVSPIGGGYLAGAKGLGNLALRSGVVGAGFGATSPIMEKGSDVKALDIGEGALVGGAIGAVASPLIGVAGKGLIKGAEKVGKYGTALVKGGVEGAKKSIARDISAIKTPGVETITRNIPKAVVRRDLGFTPTERAKIEKITGQDEGTYILSKGLAGKGKEELAEVFMKQSDDMYNGITRDLSKVNVKVQSPVAKEALLDIMEQLESSPKIARAYAKDIQGVKEMLARDEFTLSELNNIRRAYDKVNTGMFTVQGKARSGLENAIDVKVRQDLSNQLQKEAKKYGVDVKAMNTELRAGLEMKDALLRRLSQEERNNFIGLQDLGVSAILSGGEPVSAVATIIAKKYAEKVAPGLAQKAFNLNKTPNVTRNVSRGNTISPRNKSSQLGLASNPSSPVVSNVVKPKIKPKPIVKSSPQVKPVDRQSAIKSDFLSNSEAKLSDTELKNLAKISLQKSKSPTGNGRVNSDNMADYKTYARIRDYFNKIGDTSVAKLESVVKPVEKTVVKPTAESDKTFGRMSEGSLQSVKNDIAKYTGLSKSAVDNYTKGMSQSEIVRLSNEIGNLDAKGKIDFAQKILKHKSLSPQKTVKPVEKTSSTEANGPRVLGKMGKVETKTTLKSPTSFEEGMRRPFTIGNNKPIVKRAGDVDSVILNKIKGREITLYRGTKEGSDYSGVGGQWHGAGKYYTDSKAEASLYGPSVKEYKVKLNNPFDLTSKKDIIDIFGETKGLSDKKIGNSTFGEVSKKRKEIMSQITKEKLNIWDGSKPGFKHVEFVYDGKPYTKYNAVPSELDTNYLKEIFTERVLKDKYNIDNIPVRVSEAIDPNEFSTIIKRLGYDGIITPNSQLPTGYEYIIFEQPKSISPQKTVKPKSLTPKKQSATIGDMETKKLIEEARKYKSAEEFIKAQGEPVYHGSKEKIYEFKSGFGGTNIKNSASEGGIFFAKNKSISRDYAKIASLDERTGELGKGKITEAYLFPKKEFTIDYKNKQMLFETIANDLKRGKELGYDLITLKGWRDGIGGVQKVVLNPSIIKTKEQLIDIWRKNN